jgi:PTS system mannose-specific IID component
MARVSWLIVWQLQSYQVSLAFSILIRGFGTGSITGNILGAVIAALGEPVFQIIWTRLTAGWSYKGGSRLTEFLFSGEMMEYVMKGAKILGCAAFGALTATVVKTTTAVDLTFSNGFQFNLQKSLFDAIIVGIIPLGVTLFTFGLLNKGFKVTRILLIYMVAAFLLGALRILA